MCLLINPRINQEQRHATAMLCCQFLQWASLMVSGGSSSTDARPNHTVFVTMLWATRLYASCAMHSDTTEWRIMDVPALLQHNVRIAPVSLHPPTMLGSKEGISVDSVRSIQCSMRRAISEAARHLMRPAPAAEGAQWCGAPSAMRRAT